MPPIPINTKADVQNVLGEVINRILNGAGITPEGAEAVVGACAVFLESLEPTGGGD